MFVLEHANGISGACTVSAEIVSADSRSHAPFFVHTVTAIKMTLITPINNIMARHKHANS